MRADVTRTDNYSCVVTPKKACPQNNANTLDGIGPPSEAGLSTGVCDAVCVCYHATHHSLSVLLSKIAGGEPDKSTTDTCTPATDERLGCLGNQVDGRDGKV